MKGMVFKSVGTKLFAALFCTTLLLTSVLGLTSYNASKRIITDQVASASEQSVTQAADKLDFLLSQYESLSRQYAVDATLKADLAAIHNRASAPADISAAEERIKQKLTALTASDERLVGVRLVAKSLIDSESYKSVGLNNLRSDEGVEERLKAVEAAKGNPVWFPTRTRGFFDINPDPSFAMGRLLRNLKNPELEYYLIIEVKGQALGDLLANFHIGDKGQIRIVTADNRIVYPADKDSLGQEFFVALPKQKDNKESSKEQQSITAADRSGNDQLVVYHGIRSADWTLAGYAPVSDFTHSAKRLLYITLIVVACAALIALLIGYLLVRMIGRPLGMLAKLMERGENGDLTVRASFGGRDEIGRVGHSFNQMMEQLGGLARQSGQSAQDVLTTSAKLVVASGEISVNAREVAAASEEIANGTASLAEEADKSSRNVQRMGEQMKEVAGINQVLDRSAERLLGVSGQGGKLMEMLVAKSESTLDMMNRIEQNSARLQESLRLIAGLLAPMIAINKQTNILALNASIEAVRAGAAGRGFIVIADEIRGLANQSGRSIESVSRIADEIGLDIGNMVEAVQAAVPLFQEQIAAVRDTSETFADVKAEMEKYMEHLRKSSQAVSDLLVSQQEMGESINSVSAVVQQTAASTEEVASMSSQQFRISEQLVRLSGLLEKLAASLQDSLISFHTGEEAAPEADSAEGQSAVENLQQSA
ncbi:methyl-accepting chemotaxis protein [Paenibacillus spiritus]|nr:methyl-accepting chemotaxis protein [Paenibacillus spiritus]